MLNENYFIYLDLFIDNSGGGGIIQFQAIVAVSLDQGHNYTNEIFYFSLYYHFLEKKNWQIIDNYWFRVFSRFRPFG